MDKAIKILNKEHFYNVLENYVDTHVWNDGTLVMDIEYDIAMEYIILTTKGKIFFGGSRDIESAIAAKLLEEVKHEA